MKKLSVMLCLIALLAFTLNGCGGSGTTDTSYYGGGDSGGTTTTPTVTSCTTNLTPGQTCSIGGSGFGSSRDSGASTVSFVPQVTGGTTLTATTYLSWSDTAIQCVTPSVVTGIQYVVIVNRYTSSGTVSSSSTGSSANMTTGTAATAAPSVTSQSPNPATAGASVTLTGTNFPISYGYILVNGTVVSSTFTTTTATFTVPSTITANATVTLGGGAGGSTTYTLVVSGGSTTPTITAVTPNPVALGATLTITGTGFGTTTGSVTVGSVALTSLTWSATTVTGTVPATGLTQGSTYTVTLTTSTSQTATGSVRISNPATDPTITSITPSSITQGTATLITIAGTKFGTTQGTLSYTLSGSTTPTTLTVGSWSDTSVTATIPATVTAGTYTLTLTTSGSVTATGSFTVTTTPITTKSWHTATITGSQISNIGGFGMAMLSSGNPVFLFSQENGTNAGINHVWARILSGTTWGAINQLDSAAALAAQTTTNHRIACDSSGNALAVWRQNDGASNQIYSAYYNGSTWTAPTITQTVNTSAQGADAGTFLALSFDSNNSALCVWHAGAAGTTGIASRQFQGGAWGTVVNGLGNAVASVVNGGSFRFVPGTRTGLLTWNEVPVATNHIYARKVDTSLNSGIYGAGQWLAITAALDPTLPGQAATGAPGMTVNSTSGVVVYAMNGGGIFNLYSNEYTVATDTWATTAKRADAGDMTAASVFSLAHVNGNPGMVYQTGALGAAGTKSVYQSYVSSTWSTTSTTVSGTDLVFGLINCPAVLSADGSGGALCLITQQTSGINRIFSASYASGAWTKPTQTSTPIDAGDAVQAITPVLAHNSLGNAFAGFVRTANQLVYTNLYY